MFNFFQKKYFLKDYLDSFIDIHNHILPGIDDGAADVETSIELMKGFQKLGISQFIATPHVMNDYYPNTPERIINARKALITELELRGMKETKVKAAAEDMMDQAFLELIEQEELLKLKENMVYTSEPGLYWTDKWGIRLEDDIIIPKSNRLVIFDPGIYHSVEKFKGIRRTYLINPWNRKPETFKYETI